MNLWRRLDVFLDRSQPWVGVFLLLMSIERGARGDYIMAAVNIAVGLGCLYTWRLEKRLKARR